MEPASSTSPCRMTVVKSRSRPRLLLPRSLSRSLTKTRSRSTPLIRFCFRGSFSRPWLRLLRPRPHRSQPPWTLLHPRRKRERRRSRRQPTRRQMRNQRLRIRPVMPPMTALTTVTALLGLTTSGTGGEWCNDVSTCLQRKDTRLGSSKQMDTQSGFNGILNNQQVYNPDFYNWNRIKIRYCNGSSFTGDVEEVDLTTNLHFRGARIFEAVIKHLLAKGMENAKNGILSGCSAGGLAAILNYDRFKSFLPNGARVKCVPDAGYFIHIPYVSGTKHIENFYNGVVETHGSAKYLSKSCTSKYGAGLVLLGIWVPENPASFCRNGPSSMGSVCLQGRNKHERYLL
ncbi:pectin acetylesterase 11 isoform X11 [Arachis hypogaea]